MARKSLDTTFGDAFLSEGCITSDEKEVDTETDFDFVAEDDFEITDACEMGDSAASEFEFSDSDEVHDFNFDDFGCDMCNCFHDMQPLPESKHSTKLDAVTALANFGQTCTNDKQRDTILDIMWICAMDRFIK